MILTLKELAEHLKLNERTVLRMAKNGQIEGSKVGGQWRFNGSQIDKVFFKKPEKEDDVPLEVLTRSRIGIPVSRLIDENRIFLDMKAKNVDEVIDELTPAALFNTLVLDIKDLREKCKKREELLSTGVGNGIAVPHPRDPISSLRTLGCFVIGRSKKGVDYNAADGKPVNYFFLICSQSIELHLHLIGQVASLVNDPTFMKAVKAAKAPKDVITAIMAHERAEFLKATQGTEE